jgi:hypothetical protein
MSVKEALVGTWKLLVTSEVDGVVRGGGLTASATPPYGRLVAQYQAFRLPTADDVLTGNVFFLETTEVALDVKTGISSSATSKGGFSVKPSEGGAWVTARARVRVRVRANHSPDPNPSPDPTPSPDPYP